MEVQCGMRRRIGDVALFAFSAKSLLAQVGIDRESPEEATRRKSKLGAEPSQKERERATASILTMSSNIISFSFSLPS